MTTLSEGNVFRDVVRYEDDSAGQLSREVVTVAAGQDLAMGAVIGKITKAIATTGTADEGNTGGGTVTTVTQGLKSKPGTYTIEAMTIVVSPLQQEFKVTDPDGNLLPDALAVGAYTSEQINFTIVEGSPVIAEGDKWTIEVSDGSGKVKEISLTAVDGTSEAYGILTADCTATADTDAVAIVKDAVIVDDNLVWPDVSPAWSADQKAAALAILKAKGIVARDEA